MVNSHLLYRLSYPGTTGKTYHRAALISRSGESQALELSHHKLLVGGGPEDPAAARADREDFLGLEDVRGHGVGNLLFGNGS